MGSGPGRASFMSASQSPGILNLPDDVDDGGGGNGADNRSRSNSADGGAGEGLANAVSFVGPLAPPSLTSSFAAGVGGRPQLLKRSSSTQFSQSSAWGGEVGPLLNDALTRASDKRKSFLGGPPGLGSGILPGNVLGGGDGNLGVMHKITEREMMMRAMTMANDAGADSKLTDHEITAIHYPEMIFFTDQADFASWLYTRKILIWLFLEEPFLSRRTTIYSSFILACIVTSLILSINTLRYSYIEL
eukprot:g15020.t1